VERHINKTKKNTPSDFVALQD
jgi:hypothetical protein